MKQLHLLSGNSLPISILSIHILRVFMKEEQ
nr:MAG TPA: hypothetical protein [Crassvirales sp.]